MLGKEKEKNLYSMLIAVWGMFTFVTVIIVYGMLDYKLRSFDKLSSNTEKLLNLQFSQMWWEENYETMLQIWELSKVQVTSQMNDYIEQLKAQNSWEAPSNVAPQDNQAVAPAAPTWTVSLEDIQSIKDESYIDWNVDAKITWLEYSDLECPFCARLHNSWTVEELKTKYPNNLNIVFNHFPLDFHANALPWAQVLECTWEISGSENFYAVMKASFKAQNSAKDFLISTAVWLGVDETALTECVDSWKYAAKVQAQMLTWSQKFGVTWTPGNVIINNETWEYKVLSWALPTSEFVKAIDELLK